jgi:hypothetical protein
MFGSYLFKVWCIFPKAPWDSGRYAFRLNSFVFNLIDAKLAEINETYNWILIWLSCFRKTHNSKTKIVRALIIVLVLIFLSGMAIEKRVVIYIFPYLVLGSVLTQSTITLLEDYSKAGMGRSRATRMFWFGFHITRKMLPDQQFLATSRLIFD